MTLKERITSELKDAMRSGNVTKRDTLRLLDSAIKNSEIEKQKREVGLSDEEVLEVIGRAVKQRQDSIRQFIEGGRAELAEKEKIELEILKPFLPEQLSKEEIETVVQGVIEQTGAAGLADLGKVMGIAMGKLKGKADGNLVREIAKSMLESK